MIEIHKNINSDLKPNKNVKIKYEISKPSYIIPSNADKLLKHLGNKTSNISTTEDKKNLTNLKNNNRYDKKQNSTKNRIKEKYNKDKIKSNDSIQKKRTINNNHIKYPHNTIQSPITKTKIHKRINSLDNNGKDNNKNIKPVSNHYKNNPKNNNTSNNKNTNSIDYSLNQSQKQKINSHNNNNSINNKINNNNSNNIDPTISSSNNISFSSENKKISKNEDNNNNTIYNKKYIPPMRIDEIDRNDMYFSFQKNFDNNLSSLEEKEKEKGKGLNKIKNIKINNTTLSGKIASRAKNLNKMLEENFNTAKKDNKEIENVKDTIKQDKKKEISELINFKNSPLNEFLYHSINSEKITTSNHNYINKITRQKQNKLSTELALKKKKMQHKTASLNRSLDLRRKHKINDNLNNNNEINNHNLHNNSTCKNKKPMKVFSKNDFRQINTSPFVRSKPPIRPKPTNYLPGKISLKKNNNMKSIEKKYKSPQKEINSVSGFISIDIQKKNTNNIKKSILAKKKKVIAKKKNKSMIIDNKVDEKNDNKNINIDKEENNINSNSNNNSKNEKDNKNANSFMNISLNNNNDSMKIKKPIRAQSQQELNSEGLLDNINNILEKQNEDNKYLQKSNKKILKLQSLCKKGFAGPGIKKTNQDNFFIYNNFNNNSNYIYMGVCDGHGMFGQDVSGYLVNTLPQNMNTNLLNLNISSLSTESSIKIFPIIQSTFISTNLDMTEDERVDSSFSGSTCVSLFYTPSKLICANVGDSRCVIGKFDGNNWKSKNLSRDQKPSEQDEFERIINSGGRVESFKDENGNYIGPERVWLKEEDIPGLAMSRSFGDEIAHTVGVITEPEINEYYFLEEDKFIIIASDGLWEFISSDECIEMVKEFYLKNDIDGALSYLYKESSKRWIMEEEVIDDITILMAFLN